MEVKPQTIIDYTDPNGDTPIQDWLNDLDPMTASRIRARLRRVEFGNFGDMKPVGSGVSEFRFNFGSGYRLYFARYGESIVLLLCGGDKGSQTKDIEQAQNYWADFKRRNNA